MVEGAKGQQRERRRRRRKRKPNESDVKLAGRDHETRGTRTRRRTNGGSFSSRGSATSMQCGLCEVLASLFRRVMCIAGSRRGSGESCYQELATEVQMQQQQQSLGAQASLESTPCSVIVAISSASPERTSSFSHRTIKEIIPEVQRPSSEVAIDPVEQNAVFIRISEDATLPVTGDTPEAPEDETDDTPPPSRRLSETDRHLLDCIDVSETRTRHTGRFLTMHKRRRKKLTTRSLNQEPGLLDDIFHGQVQCVLQRAGHWRFNAFTLETVSGGRSLPVLCVHLFKWYGLLQHFNLDVVRVWKLFALIEEGYHSTNPYHNSIHATDVTQAMHCFLQEDKIKKYLNNLEVMASLIAAVTHDLDHPGVNQPFLVATSNHLATLYENTSVLENHHWRSAIGCLLESGVYEQLPAEIRPELQRYISSLILATDITRQQEFLMRFKSYLDKNTLDMQRPEYRHFILQIALKCADISNPCRPWDISRKWSYKVCEEFFRQGDYERQLNLPVTPLCDRHTISIPKIQSGFFEFVVTPLYEEWHRFLGAGLSDTLMEHLRINQKRWQSLIVQEAAEETKTEMSDLEELQDSPSFDEEINVELPESGSCDILLSDPSTKALPSSRRSSLPVLSESQHVERRHSVPMSVAKPLTLLQPRSGRRESVPADHPKFKTPLVKLDDRGLSSLSLLSSRSSPMGSNSPSERPVSAENLLPETSIASITSSVEASRINSVLQPDSGLRSGQSRQLTRQQTFPPLQPYARIRYMSTTAEMSKYRTETLLEADSPTSSMCSSSLEKPVATSETRRERKISTRSYTVVEPPKARRESAYADFNRLCVDSSFTSERRRHSVQCMKTDDSMTTKHQRHKRPSSAQEADPTQIFYATLIGGSRVRHKSHGSDLTCSDSRPGSRSESERQWSMEESAMEEQFVDKCGPLPETSMKFKDTEPRRFSAPTPENRSAESTVRRFTTIPVTTDLPVTKVFFIGSPPESPPRQKSSSGSSDSGKSLGDNGDAVASGKRDCSDVSSRHKNSKIPKLSDDLMKENVDPRTIIEETKGIFTSRRTSQGWARRRGSAPVGLMARIDDVAPLATRVGGSTRRGSVPTDISEHRALTAGAAFRLALGSCGENLPSARRGSLPHDTTVNNIVVFADDRPINNNNNNSHHSGSVGNNNVSTKLAEGTIGSAMLSPRRGSVPADISELRRDLFGRNSVNGKTRNRKKTLRRRSSGGPEMFSGGQMDDNDNGSSKYSAWKRDLSKRDAIPEPSVKRRGSLPVEMVSISHSGRYNYR